MSYLRDREEWLDQLMAKDFDYDSAHPLIARMRHLAETSDSPATLAYIFNQRFGAPRTKIELFVEDEAIFVAFAEALTEDDRISRDLAVDLIEAVHNKIKSRVA